MTNDVGVEPWAHFASINNPCRDHGTENGRPCCVGPVQDRMPFDL